MIPKIIHFIWVGDKEKPQLVQACIKSWKKYCPEYKIMEWGNSDLEKIDNLYVRQAFESKKWAFVSDYLRLYALNLYGGFYCDTDLEITASIEKFRQYDFVGGYELYNNHVSPMTAFIGATKNNPIINDFLKTYDNIPFIKNDELDETTNVIRIAKYFEQKYGLTKPYNGRETTILEEKAAIFPINFFCTPDYNKENYAIHHFSGSWLGSYSRRKKIGIGKYKIVRFKKNRYVEDENLPLLANEKILLEINILGKIYCLIKID